MPRQVRTHLSHRLWSRFHHIAPGAAMHVNIEIGGNDGGLRELLCGRRSFVFITAQASYRRDDAIFHFNEWILERLARVQQITASDRTPHPLSSAALNSIVRSSPGNRLR